MADYIAKDTGYIIGVYINNSYLNPELIRKLEWTEDIEQSLMTGSITFVDVNDRIKTLTGSDKIDIIHDVAYGLNSVEGEKRLNFIAYEVLLQPMAQLQTKYNIITIKFIERVYLALCETKFCSSWSETKTSDIIQDIVSDNEKLVDAGNEAFRSAGRVGDPVFDIVDDTADSIDYVMPNCTAIESIRWLMRRTKSQVHNTAGYLFYSSNIGLNFTSIKNLISINSFEDGKPTYTANPFGGDNNISRFRVLDHMVNYPRLRSVPKISGNTYIGGSCMNSGLAKSVQVYSEVAKTLSGMGDFGLFADMSSFGNIKYVGDDDSDILTNMAVHDFCREYIKQHTISIKVFGWPDQRKAGMKIKLVWPDNVQGKEKINFKPLSGDYLVKTIRHEWGKENNSNYTQSMLLLTIAYSGETTTLNMKG